MTPEQEKLRGLLIRPKSIDAFTWEDIEWLLSQVIEEREAHKRTEGFLEVERNNHKVSIAEWEKAEAELATENKDNFAMSAEMELLRNDRDYWLKQASEFEARLTKAEAELAEARKALARYQSPAQQSSTQIDAAMQSNSTEEGKEK